MNNIEKLFSLTMSTDIEHHKLYYNITDDELRQQVADYFLDVFEKLDIEMTNYDTLSPDFSINLPFLYLLTYIPWNEPNNRLYTPTVRIAFVAPNTSELIVSHIDYECNWYEAGNYDYQKVIEHAKQEIVNLLKQEIK